jgi:hypothetical protein
MATRSTVNIDKSSIAKIYDGLDKAGLGGFRIVSLHLAPAARSAGAAAVDPANTCHSVQLPNGHYVIICD